MSQMPYNLDTKHFVRVNESKDTFLDYFIDTIYPITNIW